MIVASLGIMRTRGRMSFVARMVSTIAANADRRVPAIPLTMTQNMIAAELMIAFLSLSRRE